MKFALPLVKTLVITSSILLAACGSSSDDGDDPAFSISGKAEAPGGMIAQFETRKPVFLATLDFVMPAATAAITGLQAVGGATVELIRIDDDGNQVGAVLASTVTSITGDYSLALPSGVSLAGNLVVRISGSTASMSAMVVEQEVDINPVSEYVLSKFVDETDLVLADLPVNEVVALHGKVEQFDLTATGDLSSMLDLLEAETGSFVDNEVAAISATPDDGTVASSVAGSWNMSEFAFSLHDSDLTDTSNFANFGVIGLDAFAEEISITSIGNGELEIADGTLLLDTYTNFATFNDGFDNVTANLNHTVWLTSEDESFDATIDADGVIIVESPFEEDLETVDILVDTDGPDFGWRTPPMTNILRPLANGDTYFMQNIDAGVRYGTTDTDGDGVKDAIDPNARDGDEVNLTMLMFLKQGNSMTNASLDGDYGYVSLTVDLETTPQTLFESTVGILNANNGTMTANVNSEDVVEISRTYNLFLDVNLAKSTSTGPAMSESFPYSVTSTGQVTLDFAGDLSDVLEGYASNDGSLLAFVDSEVFGDPVLTASFHDLLYAVQLGDDMSATLAGTSYAIHPMMLTLRPNGAIEVTTLKEATLEFDPVVDDATLTGTLRGFKRDDDLANIETLGPSNYGGPDFTNLTVSANGMISMDRADSTVTEALDGFVSVDGSLLVLRYQMSDTSDGAEMIGLVVGSRL
ncbi:MAG: hypothetical protein QNJ69_03235 [Gammaproteobacteria bacterium]|nr:hypothetical protein [Gammaproteobacteria bacterium]